MDTGSNQRDVLPNTYGSRLLQYGSSDFDRRHVAVVNFIYELPFFEDKKTLTGKLLGGWQISEISQFPTGSRVSVQTTEDIAGVGSGSGNSGAANNGVSTRYTVNGKIAQPARFGDEGQWYAFKCRRQYPASRDGNFQRLTQPQPFLPAGIPKLERGDDEKLPHHGKPIRDLAIRGL
jgi:hypothetical protein